MGRLIDADALKADLEKAISNNEDMDCLDFLRVASVIDAQPTAYDPDKVVEQLEKRKMNALRRMNENRGTAFGYASERVYNAWNDAIEIVKGGVSDGN